MENKSTSQKSVGRLIRELANVAHIYFNFKFKDYSIGHAQIGALLFIEQNQNISQQELAELMNLDKSSITSQLNILEKNGYITRKCSLKDARIKELVLTDKAKEIITPLRGIFTSWTDNLLEGFDETERENVFNYLNRMLVNALNKVEQVKN